MHTWSSRGTRGELRQHRERRASDGDRQGGGRCGHRRRGQSNELVVRKDALERLKVEYREHQERGNSLKAEVDAEIEHLAALYDEADAAVGRAVREASAADAAYRDALSAVDAAQAWEEERRRQEERAPATTTPPPEEEEEAPPTTTAPPETPETTDGGEGGGGGDFDFPPTVERWRSLVQAYFPSSRGRRGTRRPGM